MIAPPARWGRRLVLLTAATAIAMLIAARWWRGRPERRLAEAAGALSRSDPGATLALLPIAESEPRTRDRALLLRARASIALGRIPEAARAIDAAAPSGPLATEIGLLRGRVLFESKRTALAASWFRWAAERSPDDLEARRWLAAASYEQGDRPSAISALEGVTRLDPRDARAWRTLALLYKEDVDYERAEPAYAATLRVDPAQPLVRLERADTLIKLGRIDLAESELATCRGRVPESDRVDLLARCLGLRGDGDARRQALDRALAGDPGHPGLLAQRAEIDFDEGRPGEALVRLDRAIGADPFDGERVYRRATVLRALGRTQDAARDHARAAELNRGLAEMERLNDRAAQSPEDPRVRCQLGRLCEGLGKRQLAASWYRAALACEPDDPEAKAGLAGLGPR